MSRQEVQKTHSNMKITRDLQNEFYIPDGAQVIDFPLHENIGGEKNSIKLVMEIYEAPVTGTELVFNYVKTNGEMWKDVRPVEPGSWIDITFSNTVKLLVSTKGPLKGAYNVFSV
ncbi:hypothetical protein [Bacillus cereus]|uniref:hypothetical protein n=1 Tax=Bacillus cereus TaxID=1396 RepID=UPI000BECDD7D|nr:hypothetical protein [Bacillus cereus]PEA06340.1 hypothetical protein CON37_02030 [Bacillus cereus]